MIKDIFKAVFVFFVAIAGANAGATCNADRVCRPEDLTTYIPRPMDRFGNVFFSAVISATHRNYTDTIDVVEPAAIAEKWPSMSLLTGAWVKAPDLFGPPRTLSHEEAQEVWRNYLETSDEVSAREAEALKSSIFNY